MDFSFIEKIVLNHLSKHPEILEKLVEAIINRILDSLIQVK